MGIIGAIISWAVCGLVIGAIARMLVPGRQEMGLMMTAVMGVIGALAGGLVTHAIFGTRDDALTYWPGWLMAIVGATVVVWIYAAMGKRNHARS